MIYAKKKFKNSIIVIDFWNSHDTSFKNKKGIYNGVSYNSGIDLSLKSLKNMTAKLPLVEFKNKKKLLVIQPLVQFQSGFLGLCLND